MKFCPYYVEFVHSLSAKHILGGEIISCLAVLLYRLKIDHMQAHGHGIKQPHSGESLVLPRIYNKCCGLSSNYHYLSKTTTHLLWMRGSS